MNGIIWVPAVLLAVAGCEPSESDAPPGTTLLASEDKELVSLDALPEWDADVALTIGIDGAEGHDFVSPIPLGADEAGRVYVLDQSLREVRRFDVEGRFDGVIVRAGPGPGEMGSPPWTSGLKAGTIWYSDLATGRVHYVPLSEGAKPYIGDSGWTPYTESGQRRDVYVFPNSNLRGYTVRSEVNVPLSGLRARKRIQYLRTNRLSAQLIYEYETTGSTVFLDNGRTMIGYPGPRDHAVVFLDEERGYVLRIDRPIDSRMPYSRVRFQLIRETGEVIRTRELHLDPVSLQTAARDSIERVLVRRASWDGGRTLTPEVMRDLAGLVQALPSRLPAFEDAVQGPAASVWLRLPVDGPPGLSDVEWMVVDSLFNPVARARIPREAVHLEYLEDGAWWVILRNDLDEQYVARLTLRVESVEGTPQ